MPLFFSLPFTGQEQVEEKQRYLANVRAFCSLTKNDWHRVYLIRKVASQYGMEFAQKLATETQYKWVFPVEILQQVKVSPWRWLWSSPALQVVLLLGCFYCCMAPGGHITVRVKVTYAHSVEWSFLGQHLGCHACCLFAKAETPRFSRGRGDSAFSSGWLMSTVLLWTLTWLMFPVMSVGFSPCRCRTASLITSIATWHVARVTGSCVMLWGKP